MGHTDNNAFGERPRTIFRIASRHKPFAQLGNGMLRDQRLSLEARGALSFILSYPENWKFHEAWFCRETGIGRDKARRIIRELLDVGYCHRRRRRAPDGTLGAAEYIFTDEPGEIAEWSHESKPRDSTNGEKPAVGELETEKPTLADTPYTNNIEEETRTKIRKTKNTQHSLKSLQPGSAIEELRRADYANTLSPFLLSPRGLQGYLMLIEKYGTVAHSAILAKLSQFAIDGAEACQIYTWDYFEGAIEDERRAIYLQQNNVRPGDVFGLHRKAPVE